MNPEQWTNFFVLVGSGSTALAGLVFVAITINLRGVAEEATHRYRAINMLTGFSSAFIFFLISGSWLLIVGTLPAADRRAE